MLMAPPIHASYDPTEQIAFRRRLGAGIERERLAYGMSSSELARRIGSSRALVYRWQSGQNMPSAFYLERVAIALRTTIETLLEEDPCKRS
jgi:transcriptional regulator with XRE-family HTH domain